MSTTNPIEQDPLLNELKRNLKQRLKEGEAVLTTNDSNEICGRLTYIADTGCFLYAPSTGVDMFAGSDEISLVEVAHILDFEAQQEYNKIQKKLLAAKFLDS